MPVNTPISNRENLELSELQLKFSGRRSAKRILISAGAPHAKDRLLPLVHSLVLSNVTVYATEGTARHFANAGLLVNRVYKIADKTEPNILSLLKKGTFDCVINIPVGNPDYDAASDNKIIRSLSIAHEIPLIIDIDLAIEQLSFLLKKMNIEQAPPDAWDLRHHFDFLVNQRGGWISHHGHFDKSYLISPDNLALSQRDMQKKWYLYRHLKENYTPEDLYARISRCVERLIAQGCTFASTMVDADSIVKTMPLEVALAVKKDYSSKIDLEVGIQPLEGVLNPETRTFFESACENADFIGGLPSRDRPQPEKHLEIILGIAKAMGKRVDVHIDQENNPDENETELLAKKTIEMQMEGRVRGIHSISLAAKPPSEQDRVIDLLLAARIGIVVCPSAALSMKALVDRSAPIHNSIAPVPKLINAGVPVYLGIDNIADLFMPMVDADIWFECRLLMEACRHYNLDDVADIACRKAPDIM